MFVCDLCVCVFHVLAMCTGMIKHNFVWAMENCLGAVLVKEPKHGQGTETWSRNRVTVRQHA